MSAYSSRSNTQGSPQGKTPGKSPTQANAANAANTAQRRAVALRYDGGAPAPVIVASGMGPLAEKIVEVAADNGVPIYEDSSLTTMLSQLQLGQPVPPELYSLIVDIYVYFLHFDPAHPEQTRIQRQAERERIEREKAEQAAQAEQAVQAEQAAQAAQAIQAEQAARMGQAATQTTGQPAAGPRSGRR